MSIKCGGQCLTCDYPIKFDTYKGCSHACKYCFVKQKYAIHNIEPMRTTKSLKSFIEGKRNFETKWCDWNIPLHWGANSDPFQICELTHKCSLECLEVFAETKYPFIVSTKNPCLLTQEPYLSLISKCRCVLQISMGCSRHDKLEPGAPPYEERLKAAAFLSDKVTRIIARIRPFFPDCHKDIIREIPRYAQAGIYGISSSSFASKKKQKGMTRIGNNYVFTNDYLAPLYREMKKVCHENGLKFFCEEDGLDHWSDDISCCGTMGLEDFKPHTYNVPHLAYDDPKPEPTEAMKESDTWQPFKCIGQSTAFAEKCKGRSFADLMLEFGAEHIEWLKSEKLKWDE